MNLNNIIEAKKNVLISRSDCPFCDRAEELLNKKNIPFEKVQKNENPILESEIREAYGHKTYPMVMLDGEFVGGCTELQNYIQN